MNLYPLGSAGRRSSTSSEPPTTRSTSTASVRSSCRARRRRPPRAAAGRAATSRAGCRPRCPRSRAVPRAREARAISGSARRSWRPAARAPGSGPASACRRPRRRRRARSADQRADEGADHDHDDRQQGGRRRRLRAWRASAWGLGGRLAAERPAGRLRRGPVARLGAGRRASPFGRLVGPLVGGQVGEHLGNLARSASSWIPRSGGEPVEGRLAARRHVFRLQTEHSGHHVVLDLAAQREVQQSPILRISLLK